MQSEAMASRKPRPRIAAEWVGFADRLRYAVETRRRQDPELTQNAVALAAGIDSGNLSKMMSGKKVAGVTANTVICLAQALLVRPVWLLIGEEPSGLADYPVRAPTRTPIPESNVRSSSRP